MHKHDVHKYRDTIKLTEDNWITWRFIVVAALKERGLWSVTDGTDPKPSSPGDSLDVWMDKDTSASTQIIQNISPDVQPIVFDAKTAAEIWSALKDEYESKNLDKIANLRHRYDTLAYVDGQPMRAHLDKLKIFRQQLKAMGDEISDTSHAMRMIRLLPPSWEGTCQVLRATQPDVKKIQDRLLAEEESRKTKLTFVNSGATHALMAAIQGCSTPEQANALLTTHFGTLLRTNVGGANSSSVHSGSSAGNNKRQIPNGNDSKRKLRNPHLICDNCKKNGHIKVNCWAPGGGKEGKGPKRTRDSDDSNPGGTSMKEDQLALVATEIALVASESPRIDATECLALSTFGNHALPPQSTLTNKRVVRPFSMNWIPDSGASSHITPNKLAFVKLRNLEHPKAIATADHGQFFASAIGEIVLEVNCNLVRSSRIRLTDVLYAPECGANLLSVGALDRKGFDILFGNEQIKIVERRSSTTVATGNKSGNLYSISATVPKVSQHGEIRLPSEIPQIDLAATAVPVGPLSKLSGSSYLLLLHERLSHLNWRAIREMVNKRLVRGVSPDQLPSENPFCSHCAFGKQHVLPFNNPDHAPPPTRPLELVVSNLCGPFPLSIGNKAYFITFQDIFTRFVVVNFLKKKSDALDAFKSYVAYAERIHGLKLLWLGTDNGGEFKSQEFRDYCKPLGISQCFTAPHSSASNGTSERGHRTYQEGALALLHSSQLGHGFWPEAVNTVVYTKNRSWHSGINAVPYTRWFGHQPTISHLRKFGVPVTFLVHPSTRRKLGYHAQKGQFVGYKPDSNAYRVYSHENQRFYATRNVTFMELDYPDPVQLLPPTYNPYDDSDLPVATSGDIPRDMSISPEPTDVDDLPPPLEEIVSESRLGSPEVEEVSGPLPSVHDSTQVLAKSKRGGRWELVEDRGDFNELGRKKRSWETDHQQYGSGQRRNNATESANIAEPISWARRLVNRVLDPSTPLDQAYAALDAELESIRFGEQGLDDIRAFLANENKGIDWRAAMAGPERFEWRKAMEKEMEKLESKQVFEIVDIPTDSKVIPTTWALTRRTDSIGSKLGLAARTVAQGFYQVPNINYFESYASVPQMSTVRIFLGIVAYLGMQLRNVDVVGAFLEAPLKEKVYVHPPPGFELPPNKCWFLLKALYGLRQSPIEFEHHRNAQLESIGWKRSVAAVCLFWKIVEEPDRRILFGSCWHSDDGLAAGTVSSDVMDAEMKLIGSVLPIETKDKESYLKMNVRHFPEKELITVAQPAMIDRLAAMLHVTGSRPVNTPLYPSEYWIIGPGDNGIASPGFAGVEYASAVGLLNYIAVCTRPDVVHAARHLSSVLKCPNKGAWIQLNRCAAYLFQTKDWVLTFGLPSSFTTGDPTRDFYTVFSDSDFASDASDRVSVSGGVSFLQGSPITWYSKKQVGTVALSSMEAETIAGCLAVKEALWLRKFFPEIDGDLAEDIPVTIAIDNQAAIFFSQSPIDHQKTKHIDIKYQFIKQAVAANQVKIYYVPSEINPADIFTKSLRADRHVALMRLLGMRHLEEVC